MSDLHLSKIIPSGVSRQTLLDHSSCLLPLFHGTDRAIAYWNGYTRPIFVYGTLMKEQRADHMLSGCVFGGNFQLKNYAMYDLGAYPGIRSCSGESVLGELYFATDDVIAQLDRYEGEGYLYSRVPVTLHMEHSRFAAETYIYSRDVSGCRKIREVWNAHDNDLVWYAGYGSNLSQDRFSCYISGGVCKENGRTYVGSSDPTPAKAIRRKSYPGEVYLGNNSTSWDNCGVAFFDPMPKDKDAHVYMKLYLITHRQLHDVMAQEGQRSTWYGRLVCLEIDDRGIPVYTLTIEIRRPTNAPSLAYTNLMGKVLSEEFKLRKTQIGAYPKNGR